MHRVHAWRDSILHTVHSITSIHYHQTQLQDNRLAEDNIDSVLENSIGDCKVIVQVIWFGGSNFAASMCEQPEINWKYGPRIFLSIFSSSMKLSTVL